MTSPALRTFAHLKEEEEEEEKEFQTSNTKLVLFGGSQDFDDDENFFSTTTTKPSMKPSCYRMSILLESIKIKINYTDLYKYISLLVGKKSEDKF